MNALITGSIALLSLITAPQEPQLQPNAPELILAERVENAGQFKVNETDHLELNVPYVHQYYDLPEARQGEIMWSACGPTALTMSFQYHGVDTDLITVIDKLPSSVYVKGVMFYDLYSGAKIYNFEAVKIERNASAIYQTLTEGYPVIINVQNYMGWVGHGMVVTGIKGYNAETGTADSLIIHDPTGGESREFKFLSATTLQQPEGYTNYIGILEPFYLKPIE